MVRLSMPRFLVTVSMFLVLVAIAACSGDDSPSGGGKADTTAPTMSNVDAIDANHIDVTFNENLQRASAEDGGNYVIVESSTPLPEASSFGTAPGETLAVFTAVLKSDKRTVSLTTDAMTAVPYDMSVTGVADASGNEISEAVSSPFTGSADPDLTPPELVSHVPASNATGVAVGTSLTLVFSEAVTYASVMSGVSWTSNAGDVIFDALSEDNGVHVTITPSDPLALATKYTVTLDGVEDYDSNAMPTPVTWSFTTTGTVDHTPPTLVSSVPANGATYVDVDSDLSLTFSEAISQNEINIQPYPDFGDGDLTFTNNGKTLSFDPFEPMQPDQQYTLTIFPDGVKDLSGNGIVDLKTIRFTTGNALATGSIAGTLTGDNLSDYADDPTGAFVFAVVGPIYYLEFFEIAGTAVVAANNGYDLQALIDGDYTPLAIMDTNNNGRFDPDFGDALGALGMDRRNGDVTTDSVTISGGNRVTGANFKLVDPSAITGTVAYNGVYSSEFHFVGIGLFNTVGFDPNSEPDYTASGFWPDSGVWVFNNLGEGPSSGSFYVGAYLDADDSGSYDPGSDPAGFYGGIGSPTAISVANGRDTNDIVIPILDAAATNSSMAVKWTVKESKTTKWLQRLTKAVAESRQAAAARKWNDPAGSR